MNPRKCVICGREFVPHNPKQKMCDREHWHPCPNCGKPVLTKSPSEVNKCCCRKCGQAIAQKKREDNFKAEGVKSLKDVQEKKTYRKVCKYCGKPFETHNARQVYCGNDYYNCPVCGKRVKINKDRSNIGAACSKECRKIRIEQTNLKKYGSKHSVTSEHAKKLTIEHNLEKYGTEYPMQSESVKSKYVSTMNERYGVSYPIQNDKIKKKIQDTNVSKYGFVSPMQNDKVKSKARETLEEKYGGVGLCSQEIRDKAKATNLERYGFDHPWKSEEVREKIEKTTKERYGSLNYFSSDERYFRNNVSEFQLTQWKKFKESPESYLKSLSDNNLSVKKLSKIFGIGETPIWAILHDNNLYSYISYRWSNIEQEVYEYVKSVYKGTIVRNDRKVIAPLEIDIFIPELKFGIEVNPTATHNSSVSLFKDQKPVPYSYHKKKCDKAEKVGISIFTVWDYDWNDKQAIVKSMIASRLKKSAKRLYARNLYFEKVEAKKANEFLNDNHLKGSCTSSYRFGLYDGFDLISLMTFGKLRSTQGLKNDDALSLELSRFCSKANCEVVGGASKIFKNALLEICKHESVKKIVSFSDKATTTGNVYSKLGFAKVSESDPNYVWVKLSTGRVVSRVSAQKKNLKKLLKDDSIDLSKTEKQIMIEHGFVQVFDCGTIRWEYQL